MKRPGWKPLRARWKRLRGVFGKQQFEREMRDELESHLALHMADNLKSGMPPDEARRHALLALGGESLKEAYRERNTAPFLEHILRDLRFTIRQLRKNPVFAGTVVAVLALGLSASLAIFAFVDAALMRPLPYPDPGRLVVATESSPGIPRGNLSYQDYQDWKRENTVFRSLDVFTGSGFLLDAPGGAEPMNTGAVSAGFFRTLGVTPLLGRDFTEREELPGGPHVTLLSFGIWQRRYGGRRDIVGQAVALSGEAYTVIGVLPENFRFALLGTAELWTPIDRLSECQQRRSCHSLSGVARLKEGVTVAGALANMSAIAKRLEAQYPDSNRGQGARVLPLSEAIIGNIRPILLLLMGGAGLLLLIAGVNVASLLLLRSEGRRREMAVRSAMGASGARIASQFVTEALVLVTAATAAGLLGGSWLVKGLKALIPADMAENMPFLLETGFDWRLLIYACAVALSAIALFAFTPALHLSVSTMRNGLTEGSRGSAGQAWRRLGSRLVVVELATAMGLLVGAGLFGKSLYQLLHVELGLRPDHLATFSLQAPDDRYGKPAQSVALCRGVIRKLENLPGVQSAAVTTVLPVSFNGNTDWIRFVGKPYDGKHIEVNERDVSAEFFATIGARLVRGRYFTDAEDESRPKVMIINQTLANRYFPGEDPIGKQVGDIALSPGSIRTIIGVVADFKEGALDAEMWPAEYHPFNQDSNDYFQVVVRTAQQPESFLPQVRSALASLHSEIGVRDESTMDRHIANSMTAYLHRSSAYLVSGFALIALVLGVVGLYGVIAYSVSQRTREIGVRMALGAQHGSVYRMVLRETGTLASWGIAFGAVGSVAAATLARDLLFGVSSWDLETLVAVALVLAIAALAASLAPARRAALVNPVEALRAE